MPDQLIRAVLFDYGGVLADEGFHIGLREIGRKNGLDPEGFFLTAQELVYSSGYIVGGASESEYWNVLRAATGIRGSDEELRREILSRFLLRPRMIDAVLELKSRGLKVGILSDQTNWLDELDSRDGFFRRFDLILNSYHTRRTKRDPSTFIHACSSLRHEPGSVLFVDDNEGNVSRAASQGLQVIHFRSIERFFDELSRVLDPGRRHPDV